MSSPAAKLVEKVKGGSQGSPAKPGATGGTPKTGKPEQASDVPISSQEQQPGKEVEMEEAPIVIRDSYKGSGKLHNKVAVITGGDSGIGRSVAVHFAREGADVAIFYLDEHEDAKETASMVEKEGRKCLLFSGDVGQLDKCREVVQQTVEQLGKIDILVNNASQQHVRRDISEITVEELENTFRSNVFGYFYMAQVALPHMQEGSSIINTSSVTAFRGSSKLLSYSATKGAQIAFTRSLSLSLTKKGIRVNAVAPGPVYTPLIPSTFSEEDQKAWKTEAPMGRPAHPAEVGPTYVFLASDDGSYYSGQTLHPNGGTVLNT